MSRVPVDCAHCGEPFEAPSSLRGGFVNCPRCQKATEVSKGLEPTYWLLFGGVLVVGIGLTTLAARTGGPAGGLVVGGVFLVALLLIRFGL